MSIQLRSSDHPREGYISLGEPLAVNCPKCGVRLHTHSDRTDMDDKGQLEQVYVYLCFEDGLFTFRNSRLRTIDAKIEQAPVCRLRTCRGSTSATRPPSPADGQD